MQRCHTLLLQFTLVFLFYIFHVNAEESSSLPPPLQNSTHRKIKKTSQFLGFTRDTFLVIVVVGLVLTLCILSDFLALIVLTIRKRQKLRAAEAKALQKAKIEKEQSVYYIGTTKASTMGGGITSVASSYDLSQCDTTKARNGNGDGGDNTTALDSKMLGIEGNEPKRQSSGENTSVLDTIKLGIIEEKGKGKSQESARPPPSSSPQAPSASKNSLGRTGASPLSKETPRAGSTASKETPRANSTATEEASKNNVSAKTRFV